MYRFQTIPVHIGEVENPIRENCTFRSTFSAFIHSLSAVRWKSDFVGPKLWLVNLRNPSRSSNSNNRILEVGNEHIAASSARLYGSHTRRYFWLFHVPEFYGRLSTRLAANKFGDEAVRFSAFFCKKNNSIFRLIEEKGFSVDPSLRHKFLKEDPKRRQKKCSFSFVKRDLEARQRTEIYRYFSFAN